MSQSRIQNSRRGQKDAFFSDGKSFMNIEPKWWSLAFQIIDTAVPVALFLWFTIITATNHFNTKFDYQTEWLIEDEALSDNDVSQHFESNMKQHSIQYGYLLGVAWGCAMLVPVAGSMLVYMFSAVYGRAMPGLNIDVSAADDLSPIASQAYSFTLSIMYGWVPLEDMEISVNRALQTLALYPAFFVAYCLMTGTRDMESLIFIGALAMLTEFCYAVMMFANSANVQQKGVETWRARPITWYAMIPVVASHMFQFAWIIVRISKYPYDSIRWFQVVSAVMLCVYLGLRTIADAYFYFTVHQSYHIAIQFQDNLDNDRGGARVAQAIARIPRALVYQILHRLNMHGTFFIISLCFYFGAHGHDYIPEWAAF